MGIPSKSFGGAALTPKNSMSSSTMRMRLSDVSPRLKTPKNVNGSSSFIKKGLPAASLSPSGVIVIPFFRRPSRSSISSC